MSHYRKFFHICQAVPAAGKGFARQTNGGGAFLPRGGWRRVVPPAGWRLAGVASALRRCCIGVASALPGKPALFVWLRHGAVLPYRSPVGSLLTPRLRSFFHKTLDEIGDNCYTMRCSRYATVAQLVEQLTRNEQVVRSNRISSSKPPCMLFAHGAVLLWAPVSCSLSKMLAEWEKL